MEKGRYNVNGSFYLVSGEANFIHKVRNKILTEKERYNRECTHAHTHKTKWIEK